MLSVISSMKNLIGRSYSSSLVYRHRRGSITMFYAPHFVLTGTLCHKTVSVCKAALAIKKKSNSVC